MRKATGKRELGLDLKSLSDLTDNMGLNYRYSLNLKMERGDPSSVTQSTVEYKYEFKSTSASVTHRIPWSDFVPFYRGRPKTDAPPLNPASLNALSIMCASGFDTQKGNFVLILESIATF